VNKKCLTPPTTRDPRHKNKNKNASKKKRKKEKIQKKAVIQNNVRFKLRAVVSLMMSRAERVFTIEQSRL